jgi:hypothetical protein
MSTSAEVNVANSGQSWRIILKWKNNGQKLLCQKLLRQKLLRQKLLRQKLLALILDLHKVNSIPSKIYCQYTYM